MSSAVKLRVGALRIFGSTVVAAVLVGMTSLGSVAAPRTTLSVLVPIVSDAGDGQYISSEVLEAETAPDGDWTILVESATEHGLTLALDSRIAASITALGNDAPATAVAWLEDVSARQPLILPWGNSDPWALRTIGSFSFSAAFFAELSGHNPSELVAWPSGSLVESDSVAITASRGFTRIIAGDDVLAGGFDLASSAVLQSAVAPGTTMSAGAGAEAVTGSARNGSALVLPSNPHALDAAKAAAVLDALSDRGVTFSHFSPLAVTAGRVPLRTAGAPAVLAGLFAAVAVDRERATTITNTPDALLISRITTLSVITRDVHSSEFAAAAQAFLADTNWLSRLVSISLATEYTVLSNTAEVPVSVSNDSLAAVTIDVRVRSTSGIVHVEAPSQTITIEPKSNVRITVPMTAVANGRTALIANIRDSAGNSIGAPVVFPIEVQAQWEILTVVVFFGSVVVIMTIGIIRTIRRRRASA